jgi:hypothetical protein
MLALDNLLGINSSKNIDEEEPVVLTAKYVNGRTFTVGSWDGGGVRGIGPAIVMEEIVKRVGVEPCHFLDFGIGVSTGGILCTSYLGQKNNQPLFKASELPGFWEQHVSEIFHQTFLNKVKTLDGLLHSKYTAEGLEKVIDKIVDENMSIQDFSSPGIFPAFNATDFQPFLFRSTDVEKSLDKTIYKVKKVLRATTAAPSYFPAENLLIRNIQHVLLDGGVYNNNPAVIGYLEAKKLAGSQAKIKVLSFGTGIVDQNFSYEEIGNAGNLKYIPVLFDIIYKSMEYAPTLVLSPKEYERFQIKIESQYSALDNTKAIPYLKEKTLEWIDLHPDKLEQVTSNLKIREKENLYAHPEEFY